MKIIFLVLICFFCGSSALGHEHSTAVPEIDRKFLDDIQRPDNRPDERFDEKSKRCCTDRDSTAVDYKLVVRDGDKYAEPEWYVWVESYNAEMKLEYQWKRVPPEKIVQEYAPSGRAYVYMMSYIIQCFVRPLPHF